MIDQKKLGAFWDATVPEQYKHYRGSNFDVKAEQCLQNMRRHLLGRIDFSGIKTALDWGCGGGFGTAELSEKCQVAALDISVESLRRCEDLLRSRGRNLLRKYLLEDISRLEVEDPYDLLFSTAVVQHFPSLDYWRAVAAVWRKIKPRVIAVQTRHGDRNEDHEHVYFDEVRNYILGLRLTTGEVIDRFVDEYDLTHHYLDDDGYSMYEYYIFRRKG